jgi:Na+-transporting methylmalonyl-CoA/oxaloacetate decarboxylase gamma subunit
MDNHEMLLQAIKLMAMGFGMVFALLSVFYVLIKALFIVFPAKGGK